MAGEDQISPIILGVKHTRHHRATMRESYILDNNFPLPKVSQPLESADFNWGTEHEFIAKYWF